jgi:hypothetical protein
MPIEWLIASSIAYIIWCIAAIHCAGERGRTAFEAIMLTLALGPLGAVVVSLLPQKDLQWPRKPLSGRSIMDPDLNVTRK